MNNVMTPEEFKQAMADVYHEHWRPNHYDEEDGHIAMDTIMCDLLRDLGYGEGIDIFKSAHKWYA